MSATLTPPTTTRPPETQRAEREVRAESLRPIAVALAAFVALGTVGLGITLVIGATAAFNILVFTVFTVLWIAFAAAMLFSPGTLDRVWSRSRQLSLVVQAIAGLLLLPIAIGLWIWERGWALPIRMALIVAIGAWNIFMFFPRA